MTRPRADPRSLAELEALVARLDPRAPIGAEGALAVLRDGLGASVRTDDARYFGMPHASPLDAAVAADALVSEANPELATLEHAPFAVVAEARALQWVGERLGVAGDGVFTGGGAESNLSALLVALSRDPAFATGGVRALAKEPRVYASIEAHPSVVRAARLSGLGDAAVQPVAVDESGAMRADALRDAIGKDVAAGRAPLLVVATAGTTARGAFDPLHDAADAAARSGALLHVDAAWGGMLAFSSRSDALAGIERADTVAFDAHKGLFAPLGTGMLFVKDEDALVRTFGVRAGYLPRGDARDPVRRGLRWSRRFDGARVLAVLATLGDEGIRRRIDRFSALADRLSARLAARGFRVLPRSPLPVVGFGEGEAPARLAALADQAFARAGARIVVARTPSGARFLRAAVGSLRTTADDVDALVDALA